MKIEFGAICNHSVSSIIAALEKERAIKKREWEEKQMSKLENEKTDSIRKRILYIQAHTYGRRISTYVRCGTQRSCLYTKKLACLFLLIKTCVINK